MTPEQLRDSLAAGLAAGTPAAELWHHARAFVARGLIPRAWCEDVLGPEGTSPVAGASASAPPAPRPAAAPRPPGVGDHLAAILKQLGFADDTGCGSCGSLRAELNRLGPDGCRCDRARLAGLLRAKQQALGWGATLRAAGKAVMSGMTFIRVDDIAGSILEEAVRRAEAEG